MNSWRSDLVNFVHTWNYRDNCNNDVYIRISIIAHGADILWSMNNVYACSCVQLLKKLTAPRTA